MEIFAFLSFSVFTAVSSPTVGKPFKCSYCSRSYKQQITLEEHLERCHSYLKSLDHQTAVNTQTAQGNISYQHEDHCNCNCNFNIFTHVKSYKVCCRFSGVLFSGEESVNMETVTKPVLQPSNEKIQFVDRLAISITKRKRSTPQKFLGEFFFLIRQAMLFIFKHLHIHILLFNLKVR